MAISDTKLRAIYGKPYSGPTEITDSDGLSVRITPRGVINFQYRFRWEGKQLRLGIGKYPAIALKDARNKVSDLKESLDRGIDPRVVVESSSTKSKPSLDDCLEYWRSSYVDVNLREKTQALYKSTVIKHMVGLFPGLPADEISVKKWMDFFAEQEKLNQRRARQLLVQVRSAVAWCIRRQFLSDCAVLKIQPKDIGTKPAVGETTLSYNQLAKVWLAIERSRGSTSNKLLHQMLMLYGARNSELRLSVKKDFDREEGTWIVPAERSKTNRIIRRPIFNNIIPLLDKAAMTYGDVLFPGPDLVTSMTISGANRYLGRIVKQANFGDFTAHDFRRTLATRLSEDGVAPHVIEKMLGHELGGVLAVYNKHDWLAEQKEAYDLYAEKLFWHIKKIVD
ncbi:site-specific integrase [Rouxiella badensis]|uniref:tyrosine-type recombinase/integrase n=1 Tax=Rouxiella badensis TaxID=1646377 RepID=UPI0013EF1E61|nr:site-specific integrase [Rouxiella badensis]QII36978.1 site-specific integrase [Rouxiella badensis]